MRQQLKRRLSMGRIWEWYAELLRSNRIFGEKFLNGTFSV